MEQAEQQSNIDFIKAKKISLHPLYLKKNYLAPKDSGFPYLRYRALRPLLKLYYRTFRFFKGTSPWTSPASIAVFEKFLSKDMTAFEWGSGSSTVFFAQRIKKLVSIEHNEAWYKKVKSSLKEKKFDNVEYHFIKINYPDQHLDKDGYQAALNENQTNAYRDYFSFIDRFPDEYFDFIVVDGRARVECGFHAIPKLKPGGVLVLDNSERIRYQPLKEKLTSWQSIWTTSGLTDTTLWIKP